MRQVSGSWAEGPGISAYCRSPALNGFPHSMIHIVDERSKPGQPNGMTSAPIPEEASSTEHSIIASVGGWLPSVREARLSR